MAYIREHFDTKEQRNARYRELLDGGKHNVVKYSEAEKSGDSPWKTQWYVAYPPEYIETIEQLGPAMAAPIEESQPMPGHDLEMA